MAKKIKKLLTLEQLVQFCEQNKFYAFSAKDTGYTLSVQVPGNLNFSDKEDEDLLYTTVKVCHTLLNRNGSYISENNMKKAMPTLKYKPLLASIVEDENGELDFNGHDMDINDDGTINYIEKQIVLWYNKVYQKKGKVTMAKTKKELHEGIRNKFLKAVSDWLVEQGEEVLRTKSNEIAVLCLDEEHNDEWCVITFKVPTGSRDDGEAYDGYAIANEYAINEANKIEKAEKAKAEKERKIAKDKAKREARAKAKADHEAKKEEG